MQSAVKDIDDELGSYDSTDKNVQNMLKSLQDQITALQGAVSTPVVFTYTGLGDDVSASVIEKYFKDNLLETKDGSDVIPTDINTSNKTVVYMLPNSKTLNDTQNLEILMISSNNKYTCNVNVNDKTIKFTKAGS